MVSRLVTALAVVALGSAALVAADFRLRSFQHAKFWAANSRTEVSLRNRGLLGDALPADQLPPAQWYSQTLDHFDATNPTRWNQRYYVNDSFYAGSAANAPVFLMIQGEGALSVYDAVQGEHVELAQQYGALIVTLEHRFYGASVPVPDLTTPNLKFLSSQQALADLAEFVGFASAQYGVQPTQPWFTFGGSYAGALTAWSRLKFGDLIYGAISSSGPVQAQLEFTAYNDVVHDSLALPLVGGSEACVGAVEAAFEAVAALAAQGSNGLSQLSRDFLSCPTANLADPLDYYQFISNLAGNFQNSVQYDNDVHPNISELCVLMLNPAQDAYTNLIDVNNATAVSQQQPCVDNSWADYLAALGNTTTNPGATGVGLRQWTWQTCAEFGYYQTCDAGTNCPFDSPQVNLASFTDLCNQLFGLDASATQRRIDFTNLYYGARHPAQQRIVFVNGSVDPWHALSILSAPGANNTAIFIPGTSHCANMDASRPSDTAAMTAARKQVNAQIGAWIAQANADAKQLPRQ